MLKWTWGGRGTRSPQWQLIDGRFIGHIKGKLWLASIERLERREFSQYIGSNAFGCI